MKIPDRAPGCDFEGPPPLYMDGKGGWICRCMVCGRCGHHTGNSNQGHYWSWCKATKSMRDWHFCCPDGCELEVAHV